MNNEKLNRLKHQLFALGRYIPRNKKKRIDILKSKTLAYCKISNNRYNSVKRMNDFCAQIDRMIKGLGQESSKHGFNVILK